jgi:hypothetical protein
VVESLPKNARCYVSIDIDVLDLSLVPGCVSAEPDGMSYRQLRETLTRLAEHAEIVGFDLVEVNPQLDVATGITSYLAAHTIVEFLGAICAQPRWIAGRDQRASRRAAVASEQPAGEARSRGKAARRTAPAASSGRRPGGTQAASRRASP